MGFSGIFVHKNGKGEKIFYLCEKEIEEVEVNLRSQHFTTRWGSLGEEGPNEEAFALRSRPGYHDSGSLGLWWEHEASSLDAVQQLQLVQQFHSGPGTGPGSCAREEYHGLRNDR